MWLQSLARLAFELKYKMQNSSSLDVFKYRFVIYAVRRASNESKE